MRRFAGSFLALATALALLPLTASPAFAAYKASDFNSDGYADMVVRVPGESVGTVEDAGAVQVFYGSPSGVTALDQLWTQDAIGLDPSEDGDLFGHGLASGDFNGDGYADLAIGAPGDNGNAGSVTILYGSRIGLDADRAQHWTQDSTGLEDTAEPDDRFGEALAAANFGRSSHADLAISVKYEDLGVEDAGAVHVLYGSSSGLTATDDQLWSQDSPDVNDAAELNDFFGHALAAANFGRSSYADLAIGVPYEGLGGLADSGAVAVLYGSATGLTASGDQLWSQDSTNVNDTAEEGDNFGWALAAANLGKSGEADLAIGSPYEDIGTLDDAGAVNIIYGSSTGLTATGDQFWSQNSTDINDVAEADDQFGYALAAANFGKSAQADLAIGVRDEAVGSVLNAGAVNVIYGSSTGLTATGDQYWTQDSTDVNDAAETDDEFGSALQAVNFGKSSEADLAIGVPGEGFGGTMFSGAVAVLYGTSTGLVAAGDQLWHQDSPGVFDVDEDLDVFGA